MTIAETFGTGQVFFDMLWFFLFVIWIYLLVIVFGDIFRSPDMGGGAKALWTIFVIILPYFGVFVYLIARGGKMHEHAAQAQDAATRQYVEQAGGTKASPSAQIATLTAQRDKGLISAADFENGKAQALGG
jgi:Phospholipase_D-nuclease N-terminal